MTSKQHQESIAKIIWAIVDFCMARIGNSSLKGMNRELIFRFVAFCYVDGRICFIWENGEIKSVAFYWLDWKEHIEMKAHEKRPQFNWTKAGKGDCLFLADVFGSRKYLAKLYQEGVEKYPQILTMTVYTFRHGKLDCLYGQAIERFLFRNKKGVV